MIRDQTGVGTHGDLDARLHRGLQRLVRQGVPLLALGLGLRRGGIGLEGLDERGHQELTALDHLLTQLIGEGVAVLDTVHAALHGGLDSGETDRVRGDLAATVVVGLLHQRGHDVGAGAQPVRVIRGRGDAAGGGDLDHVDAVAQQPAHVPARLVDRVDQQATHQAGAVDARGEVEVGVTAGLAEHLVRDQQTRALHQTVRDGLAHAHVDAHEVAHRGDTGLDRDLETVDQLEVAVGRRDHGRHDRRALGAGQGEMDVAVEEAGGDGVATDVDLGGRAIGLRRSVGGTGVGDLAVLDHHHRIGNRGSAGAVDESGIVQDSRRHKG